MESSRDTTADAPSGIELLFNGAVFGALALVAASLRLAGAVSTFWSGGKYRLLQAIPGDNIGIADRLSLIGAELVIPTGILIVLAVVAIDRRGRQFAMWATWIWFAATVLDMIRDQTTFTF